MWQIPALSMTAQSFLLILIADRTVPFAVAGVVAGAGIAANLAGLVILKAGVQREKWLSDEVNRVATGLGFPDPDKGPEEHQWNPPGFDMKPVLCWPLVVAVFVGADIVALLVPR